MPLMLFETTTRFLDCLLPMHGGPRLPRFTGFAHATILYGIYKAKLHLVGFPGDEDTDPTPGGVIGVVIGLLYIPLAYLWWEVDARIYEKYLDTVGWVGTKLGFKMIDGEELHARIGG